MTFPSGWGVFAAGQHGRACGEHEWKGRGYAEQRPAPPWWVHGWGAPGGNAATTWKRQEASSQVPTAVVSGRHLLQVRQATEGVMPSSVRDRAYFFCLSKIIVGFLPCC